jgi:hypothetical protein
MVNTSDLAEDLSMAVDIRCPRCGALLPSNAPAGLCALCRQALADEPSHLADIEATTDPGATSALRGPEYSQSDSGATEADAHRPGADPGTIDITPAPTESMTASCGARERKEWQSLWTEVVALLKRAEGGTP